MATKKYVCKVCGYVHEGSDAPGVCPVCQAPMVEVAGGKKPGMFSDVNSNAYIIMYSTVMVVIVATLLAVASMALQSRQMANELKEKKSNILQSLGYNAEEQPAEFAKMLTDFDEQVKAYVLDASGAKTEVSATEAFKMMATNKDLRDNYEAKKLILFQTNDGRVVIPLIGMGLWGDIWGYIALENDMNTVSGIVMAHKGETPGLGAEIATTGYQQKFVGKQLFKDGEFVSILLRKGGAKDMEHEVDAISGGTKTSDGVTAMLRDCLIQYVPFFEAPEAADAAEVQQAESGVVSNDQNVENNE